MTTFTKSTKKHSTKGFAFAFAVMAALFGAGCEGAEGFEGGEEGGEEAVEMGQIQEAFKATVDPTKAAAGCKANGHVYNPSTGGCSATCAPGLMQSGNNQYKCISPKAKCQEIQLFGCEVCDPDYVPQVYNKYASKCPFIVSQVSQKSCSDAGNYWSQEENACYPTGSIEHYNAYCKHHGMEYDPSKAGQNFPCKYSTKNPTFTPGKPDSNCMSDPDCITVFCSFPGNSSLSVCAGG